MTSNKKNKILVLGSGTSTGIPLVGCHCSVCQSTNIKNKRLRSSVLLTTDQGKDILIDTTPDLRTQLLAHSIENIDGAIITHAHADHLHGIDDLRPLCFIPSKKVIPIFSDAQTGKQLEQRFPYIFLQSNRAVLGGGIPLLNFYPVSLNEPHKIGEDFFEFFFLPHGHYKSLGILYKKFAYIIDCNDIPSEVLAKLKERKLDLLIIDCLQESPHETHLTVEQTFNFIREIAPKRAGLIHMNHYLEHNKLEEKCRQTFDFSVFPLYDGQKLDL